ncbi:MFS transporter [Lacticaseibacillus mingshuiensis]|uniref:MFS transporter n=1 Tax=Lacticaseibacillus mingshuiensis TaxID=2799574 RepID=A0ABW4CHS4_9LACO|nr:MFS transporter [Lacticaseibacillus mingshuiensis]
MDDAMREKGPWRRNLSVLWFCTFVAGMAFSEISPFLSLFVSQMGDFSKAQLSLWSGLIYAVAYLVTAIVSPLWGRLADRTGRKVMLVRASLGIGFATLLMALCTNVWALLGARIVEGIFDGYIPNAQALVASQTPREHSGAALGTLVTGSVSGTLLGPVIGGILAQAFSIRMTFFITTGLLMVVALMSGLLVQESFVRVDPASQKNQPGLLRRLADPKLIVILLISTMVVQMGNSSIYPIISLYIQELMHGQGAITVVAGVIAALPGISNILAAPRLGRYGDRRGSGRVLMGCYLFAVLVYLPQGFIGSVIGLGVLRLLVGVSDAGLFPTIQTLLTKNVPVDATSTIFSWNQSFQALGSMFGAFFGGLLAGWLDYNAVFIATAAMLLVNLLLLRFGAPELIKDEAKKAN